MHYQFEPEEQRWWWWWWWCGALGSSGPTAPPSDRCGALQVDRMTHNPNCAAGGMCHPSFTGGGESRSNVGNDGKRRVRGQVSQV